MSAAAWELDGFVARLRTADLRGTIDLRNPSDGLTVESPDHAATLFQLHLAGPVAKLDAAGMDCFVRGGDLVAVYPETFAQPIRAEVYWRVVTGDAGWTDAAKLPASTAIELVVSVQTSLLRIDPALTVATTLAGIREAWRLHDVAAGDFVACGPSGDRPRVFEPAAGSSCFLFRGRGPLSYLEMVHPADFRQTTLGGPHAGDGSQLQHSLFESSTSELEKGVILRSRLRGMFLPRNRDQATAAAEYRRFAASEPPLTV